MKTNHIYILAAFIAFFSTLSQTKAQSKFNPTYKLDRVVYKISDDKIREALENEKQNTAFKKGQSLDQQTFKKEIDRIEKVVKLNVDPSFNKNQIKFLVDTTLSDHSFSVVTVIAKNK